MRRYRPQTNLTDDQRPRLDFTVSVFGPGMQEVTRVANRYKARHLLEHGRRLTGGHAPMGQAAAPFKDLSLIEDPAKLPLVIGGCAFGEFCGPWFKKRHVDAGRFGLGVEPNAASPLFEGVELTDPTGSYRTYGGSAFVMLVDTRKLEGKPVPNTWEAILDPLYRGMVVTGFNIDDVNEIPLVYLYRLYGLDGIRLLINNLGGLVDTLDMMRTAIPSANRYAIYLVPYFFAAAAPKHNYLTVVWPREGAFFSPFYYLAQDDPNGVARLIVEEFFTGDELARVLAGRDMFAVSGPCGSGPSIGECGILGYNDPAWAKRRLLWVGWDWLLGNGILTIMATIDNTAIPLLLERFPQLAADRGKNEWNG